MLLGSLLFAALAGLSHSIGGSCNWAIIVLVRAGIAFSLSLLLVLWNGTRLTSHLLYSSVLWLRSTAGSISLLCAFYALTHLNISTAITLGSTVPLWVVLIAWPIFGHRPTLSLWISPGFLIDRHNSYSKTRGVKQSSGYNISSGRRHWHRNSHDWTSSP